MTKPRLPNVRRLAVALMAAAFAPAFAVEPAQTPAPAAADPTTAVAAEAAPAAGQPSAMMMARDPQTGQLRAPTAEEMRTLGLWLSRDQQALNYSDEGLKQVELPDGTVMIDLQGRFMSTSIAHIDADGRLVRQCSDHPGLAVHHDDHAPLSQEVRDER